MSEPVSAATRPTRLPPLIQFIGASLLLLSFVSGVILWWGSMIQTRELEPPPWLHLWRQLHGWLNPLLCAAYGYLWARHVPVGWKMRANHKSGSLLAAVLGGLILSGTGLYYLDWRAVLFWLHLGLGLLLPLVLGLHWLVARAWAKKIQK